MNSLPFPPLSAPLETMPPPAPLDMPEQSLSHFDTRKRRRWLRLDLAQPPVFSRIFIFGIGFLLTFYGAREMYGVVNVGTITFLKWALLFLFVINFSWISIAFSSAILGFLHLASRPKSHNDLSKPLQSRTAVIMPIYNEAPGRTFAAVQAMMEEMEATGHNAHFAWFFLSDTTDPDILIAEEQAYLTLYERMAGRAHLYYRHRVKNANRKAGNIADFVTKWGGHYDHMVVLDADSLMTASAILKLTYAMEADEDAGIIQSLPLIMNRNTLFARLQQFAARIYGPVIAMGLSLWSGRDGNYWGHNAIIRMKAFADHAGLPHLSGPPPFGGHIMSHDFIEAALLRRAGYAVYMLPLLEGSYEESPPSLIDLAARDRRWCQGNLQHIRILPASGLHLATRQHLATGIMSYLASPFWMGQLLVGLALVLQSAYIRPEYFTSQFVLFPSWPRFDSERALQLFELTMGVLLAPKALGLTIALLTPKTRRACGGGIRLLVSTLLEVIMSALMAPIMMVIQTGAVVQILFGRDTGWNPQRRDDGSIPLSAIFKRHRWHVVLGLWTLIAGLLISPSLAAWMFPTIFGLVFSIPLSYASGQLSIGLTLKKWGLLLTPEETQPPPLVKRVNQIEFPEEWQDCLLKISRNQEFRRLHEAYFIPESPERPRGQINPDHALATAKLREAETIQEAVVWLQSREKMVVLQDRILIGEICRLKDELCERAKEEIFEVK